MRRCARIYFLHNLAMSGHRIECHGDSHVRQCSAIFPELDLKMPRNIKAQVQHGTLPAVPYQVAEFQGQARGLQGTNRCARAGTARARQGLKRLPTQAWSKGQFKGVRRVTIISRVCDDGLALWQDIRGGPRRIGGLRAKVESG